MEPNETFMVTEYMPNGDLQTALERHPDKIRWSLHRDDSVGRQILIDIVEGLNYLHKRTPKVLHSDIKPANILLTGNSKAPNSIF